MELNCAAMMGSRAVGNRPAVELAVSVRVHSKEWAWTVAGWIFDNVVNAPRFESECGVTCDELVKGFRDPVKRGCGQRQDDVPPGEGRAVPL